MSLRSSNSDATLVPARALLHPLWLVSLAVLVLNDHVLKGASLLPDALTGKLSDFAGLVVAPALLATVLRVRSRRGLALAHVAVAVVFGAIQLSAFAAQQWSAAMALVGFPWVITRDATDLIALVALVPSWMVLRRAMTESIASVARRGAELTAAGVGVLCCAATSPPPEEPWVWDLWTDVYVHNSSGNAIVVRMRPLADTVELDCDAVATDPGRLISEPLFGQSQSVRIEPDQNFGLRVNNEWDGGTGGWEGDESGRGCYAVLLDIDGLPPAVVFWQEAEIPEHTVPGVGYEDAEEPRGGIDLMFSDDPDRLGTYEAIGSDEIVYVLPGATPPVTGECAAQSDAERIEWSTPLPVGTKEVLEVDRGADGCFALDLGDRDIDGVVINETRWYLCAALTDLALEPGRLVRISPVNAGGLDEEGVSLTTEDPESGLPLVDLQAFRGTGFPVFHGLQVAAVPDFDCGYVLGERCGTVVRPTSITAGGGDFPIVELPPRSSQTLDGSGGAQITVAVAHSEERAALDPECAEGPDTLGLDLEVVALYTEPGM